MSTCRRLAVVDRVAASPRRSHRVFVGVQAVSYAEINAPHGHDAFLMEDPRYHNLIRAYFDNIAREVSVP